MSVLNVIFDLIKNVFNTENLRDESALKDLFLEWVQRRSFLFAPAPQNEPLRRSQSLFEINQLDRTGNSRINEAPKIDFSQFLEGILEQKIDIKNSTIQEFLTRFSDQENPQADLQEKINSYSDLFEDLKCNLKLAHLLIDKTIENPLKSELHDDPLSIKEDFEDFLVSLEDLFSKSNQLKVEHEKLQETHQEIVEEKLEIQRKSNEDSTTFALKVSSLESEIVAKDEEISKLENDNQSLRKMLEETEKSAETWKSEMSLELKNKSELINVKCQEVADQLKKMETLEKDLELLKKNYQEERESNETLKEKLFKEQINFQEIQEAWRKDKDSLELKSLEDSKKFSEIQNENIKLQNQFADFIIATENLAGKVLKWIAESFEMYDFESHDTKFGTLQNFISNLETGNLNLIPRLTQSQIRELLNASENWKLLMVKMESFELDVSVKIGNNHGILQSMKQMLEKLKSRLTDCFKKISNLGKEKSDLIRKLEQTTEDYSTLEYVNEELKVKLMEKCEAINEKQQKIEAHEKTAKNFKDEIDLMHTKNQELESQNQKQLEEINELFERIFKLQDFEIQFSDFQKDVESLAGKLIKILRDNFELPDLGMGAESDQKFDVLKEMIGVIEGDEKEQIRKRENKEILLLNDRIRTLESEKAKLLENLEGFEKESENFKTSCETIEENWKLEIEKVKEKQAEIVEQEKIISKLGSSKEELQKNLKKLSQKSKAEQEKFQVSWNAEKSALAAQLSEATSKINDLKEENLKLVDQKNALDFFLGHMVSSINEIVENNYFNLNRFESFTLNIKFFQNKLLDLVRKLTVENKSLKLGSEKLEEEKKLLEETWEKKNENLAKELLNKSDLINKQLDEISEHSKKIKELEAENLNLREVQKEEKKRLKDITNNLNFEKENLSKWAEEKEKLIKESNMKSKEIAGQLKKIHGLEVEIARLIQLQTREKELMAKIETLEEQLSAEWKKLEKMEEQKVIWLSEIENSKKLQKTLQKRAESYQKIIQEIVVLGKSGKSIPIYTV